VSVSLKLKAGKMKNPNWLRDLQKKNVKNKNRKLAKLRQKFPKCVNKWVNNWVLQIMQIVNQVELIELIFLKFKNQNFHWKTKKKIKHENK
jgi:hypothetical protein